MTITITCSRCVRPVGADEPLVAHGAARDEERERRLDEAAHVR